MPVRLGRGQNVMSGSTNAGEAFDLRVTRRASESTYAGIVRLVEAAQAGGQFELVHDAEPSEAIVEAGAYQRADGKWVYRKVDAAELWEAIIRQTYETAEPGVVFIDRINAENNLYYCEVIEATNP